MSRSSWNPGATFDRALDYEESAVVVEVVLPDTSGNRCPHNPCVTDGSICGDVGECEYTRQYRHEVRG